MSNLYRALIAGIAACFLITPVHASLFLIDEFTITRNGALFFSDSFGDGLAPPNIPSATFGDGTAASYNVLGTLGPESGGKLAIDTTQGDPVLNISESTLNLSSRARAQTNINPANLTAGLKSDDTFVVSATFDLVLPGPLRERYGIRLSDSAAVEGIDIIDLAVRRREDGQLTITFRHLDDPANTTTVIQETLLDISHDQISLFLSRSNLASNTIVAGFRYVDGGVAGPPTTFANTTTIFNGVNFTRAEFRSLTPIAVPEPSAVLLFGSGLIGWGILGYRNRRKRQ